MACSMLVVGMNKAVAGFVFAKYDQVVILWFCMNCFGMGSILAQTASIANFSDDEIKKLCVVLFFSGLVNFFPG